MKKELTKSRFSILANQHPFWMLSQDQNPSSEYVDYQGYIGSNPDIEGCYSVKLSLSIKIEASVIKEAYVVISHNQLLNGTDETDGSSMSINLTPKEALKLLTEGAQS